MFSIGDKVKLKGGSIEMVVIYVDQEIIGCSWDGGNASNFNQNDLELA